MRGLGSGLLSGLGPTAENHARLPAFLLPQYLSTSQERYAPHHFQREREIALVHSASLAYEDGSVFMTMGPDKEQR